MSQPPEPPGSDFSAESPGQPAPFGQPAPYGQPAPFGQSTSYGQGTTSAYGSPYYPDASSGPSPILVGFAPQAKQRRVTVLFRYLLLIPHLIVLAALGVAVEIVAVIGWFAALFTGQLPEWAHTFMTGGLRWQTRAYAYLFMLTDSYPPFSLDDDAYPIRLLTRPTKLNRLAVLFRIVLAIPAALLSILALYGIVALSFFLWLIALITGQFPTALHQTVAAIVRYTARYGGYFFMLTSEYPKGLFGDSVASDALTAATPGLAAAWPGAEAEATADPWRLTLSSAAKTLVAVFMVVGLGVIVICAVALSAVGTSATQSVNNALALNQIERANSSLGTSMGGFPAAVTACGGQLTCVTALDRKLGDSLRTFASTVRSVGVSGAASAAAASLVSDTNAAALDLDKLGAATSVAQYQSLASSGSLQQDLNNVSTDYLTLAKDLGAQ